MRFRKRASAASAVDVMSTVGFARPIELECLVVPLPPRMSMAEPSPNIQASADSYALAMAEESRRARRKWWHSFIAGRRS